MGVQDKMEYCQLPITDLRSLSPIASRVFATILMLYAPVTIASNGALIASLIGTKQVKNTVSNTLFIVLGILEGINAATTMPLLANFLFKQGRTENCALDRATQFGLGFFFSMPPYITVMIAVDRYIHMNPDIGASESRLAKAFKRPRVYVILAIGLVTAAAYACTCVLLPELGILAKAFLNLTAMAFAMAGMTFVATLYIRAYLRIRRFASDNLVHHHSSTTEPQYVRSLYKTVFLLVVVVCVTYTPLCFQICIVATFVIQGVSHASSGLGIFYLSGLLMVYTNGVVNCIIVLSINRKAKSWLSSTLSCNKSKSQAPNHPAIIIRNKAAFNHIMPDAITINSVS